MPGTSEERAAALWSFFYFFTLLAGYYVLRPLRDQMGIAGGVKGVALAVHGNVRDFTRRSATEHWLQGYREPGLSQSSITSS